MTYSIWARPLLDDEEAHFRTSDLGQKASGMGRLAIMAPEDHPYVALIQVKSEMHWINLDGGQGIWDGPSLNRATGGRKVPVSFGAESPYNYLEGVARELGIRYVQEPCSPGCKNPLYFERRYTEAFLDAFAHADRALAWWDKHRSPFSRWFGAVYPEPNGKEVREIQAAIRVILTAVKPQ